tara:strand:- start:6234 stop:7736 length:1503 start_codon:yes stop_codon:yes gene_type:complete
MKLPFITLLAALLLGVLTTGAAKPNIIIIYADDVGYGDLSSYGAEAIDTPSLDKLAANGVRFTAAYASASTCTPSRYSLLTGEYPFRNEKAQILPGNAPLIIDPAKPTIPSVLKSVGYATALVGKWHLGLGSATDPLDWNHEITPGPKQLGFDYSFHMAATGDRVPTVFIENGYIVGLDPNDPVSVSYEAQVGDKVTGLSHPHLLKNQADEQHAKTIVDGTSRIGWMDGGEDALWTDEEMPDEFLGKAIDFITDNQEKPFFMFYAMHENHVPRIPHPRFLGSTSLGVRGDAVVQMDWGIGRIMETIEELGLTEKTLIIFSSDNGPVLFDGYYDGAWEKNGDHQPAGPWQGGKYSVWEGGTRMPTIVSWPGTVQPGLSDAIVSQVDLLASLASLTGATVPTGRASDSQNQIEVFLGRDNNGREHVVQQGVGAKSIRAGDWKYHPPGRVRDRLRIGTNHFEPIPETGALFYLPEDPKERTNLATRYPAKTAELKALLDAELK